MKTKKRLPYKVGQIYQSTSKTARILRIHRIYDNTLHAYELHEGKEGTEDWRYFGTIERETINGWIKDDIIRLIKE